MNQTYGLLWILALFLLAGDLCFGGRHESQLRIGKALNIFVRYGFLSISIKTIANNQTERWLFKEPTRTIFKDLRPLIETKEEDEIARTFHGDFHMEFCDNHRQLYQAYFRDFTIERLNKPWEAFTGGWHPDVAAKKLGINASFISREYSYVLVRIVRFRETGKLKINIPPNQPLSADVTYGINSFETGNLTNAVKFMESFGTHYINSYITGNSLYQVFVFSRKVYHGIKDYLKSKGGFEKTHVTSIFSPLIADHLGQIRTASGNTTVERWARQIFQCNTSRFSYVALPKLYGNATLLRSVDKLLGNEAVLQMDLKSVDSIFSDVGKQKFFIEVLDNYLKLWEVNMGQSKR